MHKNLENARSVVKRPYRKPSETDAKSTFTHPPVHCENGEQLYFDENAKLLKQ